MDGWESDPFQSNQILLIILSYLTFVTGTMGGARVKLFCKVNFFPD